MPRQNTASGWLPRGFPSWPRELEQQLHVSIEAAYIELQAQLQHLVREYFIEAEKAPHFAPEFFYESFLGYAVSTYDAYARALCQLPLESGGFEVFLAGDLQIHICEGIAGWQRRGDWQRALEEAWRQFEHPRHRSLNQHAIMIADALEGPVSLYRHKFIEQLTKRLARRVRVWRLEWNKQHSQDVGEWHPEGPVVAEGERQPMPPVTQDDLGRQRRFKVDAFLAKCNQNSRRKFIRSHIWKAAGHSSPRQFQYWQAGNDRIRGAPHGASQADDLIFRRILSLSCSEWEGLQQKKKPQ